MQRDWNLNHVGMIAQKKNRQLQYFHEVGIGVSVGPQPLLPYRDGAGSVMMWRTLDGEPMESRYETSGAHTFFDGQSQIGDLQLEVIQVGPGNFLGEWGENTGGGINHLCFNVEDVDMETERLLALGCPEMFCAKTGGIITENYLDTRTFGDVILSLRPPPADFERAWQANNSAHPLVKSWTFRGLGIVTRDPAAAADYYASLGFEKEGETSARVGSALFDFLDQKGPVKFSDGRSEGVVTMDFEVKDLGAETRALEASGLARLEEHIGIAVFDTRQVGNTATRLFEA